jgi:4-amino-4-deoxy-L-arabinose transferase-like glycosyltransferase
VLSRDCDGKHAPDPTSRRRDVAEAVLVGALALTLNLMGNGRVGLWDRDEPRFAVAVREMRERGDWITPSFNGEPRYHKPILIYWINGLGTAIAGDNPFGARLGSAIAGTATCLLTLWFGRRLFGPGPALIGALALATAPLMIVESKLATTDATLALFVVLSQFCLHELNRRPSGLAAAGFWTALALATLTKGPVGPAFIAVAGLSSWWFHGRSACWRRLHWRRGLAWLLALTLPWFVAIAVASEGDFFRFAVGVQMVKRVATPVEQHGGFPGFYILSTLATFYPWSVFVPVAVLAAWRRRRESPVLGFLLGWAFGPLVLLELVQTKMIHYYLPALPALAMLVGWLIAEVAGGGLSLRRWPLGRVAVALLVGMAAVTTGGFLVGSFAMPRELRPPLIAMAVVLAIGTSAALRRFLEHRPIAGSHVLAGSWAILALVLTGWFLPAAEPYRLSRVVGEKLARLADTEMASPILLTYQEPGIHYALKRKAPTLRDWDEVEKRLWRFPALVTAATPDQVESLSTDGRFLVDVLERIDGFNLSKGKAQPVRLLRLRPTPMAMTRRPLVETQIQ